MSIRVEVHDSPETFRSLRKGWERIVEEQKLHLFSGDAWHRAWWNAFGGTSKLLIYSGYQDGHLIGVWPFCLKRSSVKNFYSTILETLSGASADYCLPAVKTGFEEVFIEKVLSDILKRTGRNIILQFPHLPSGHPASSAIANLINEKNIRADCKTSVCPMLEFGPDYGSVEKAWKKSLRTDLRRQRRRLEEKGELRLHIPGRKKEILEILPVFFEMHTAQWETRKFNMKFLDPEMRQFCRNLADELHENQLHFSYLTCGTEVISMHLGFLSSGWLLWYMPAYNMAFERQSPGKVHLHMLIEHGLGKGWKGIDFLQGNEEYKLMWSTTSVETNSYTCSKAWSLQYSWLITIKPWFLYNFGGLYRQLKPARQMAGYVDIAH
ncbi:MAG: GNAT family N-acetyltransferase [Deltaproteobacteria bacterium]|nr:GNAT family N-acetyltransferase [Deltaproteobacteria bacterium]